MPVLRSFGDHVATRLWSGEDRGELKVVTHGWNMRDFVIVHDAVGQRVDASGLAPLMSCSYQIVDKGILSAFAERWHRETSTFHLPPSNRRDDHHTQ